MRELRYQPVATKPMPDMTETYAEMGTTVEACLNDSNEPEFKKAAIRDLLSKAEADQEPSSATNK